MVLRLLCRAAVGHVRRMDILEAVETVWIQMAEPGVAVGEGSYRMPTRRLKVPKRAPATKSKIYGQPGRCNVVRF